MYIHSTQCFQALLLLFIFGSTGAAVAEPVISQSKSSKPLIGDFDEPSPSKFQGQVLRSTSRPVQDWIKIKQRSPNSSVPSARDLEIQKNMFKTFGWGDRQIYLSSFDDGKQYLGRSIYNIEDELGSPRYKMDNVMEYRCLVKSTKCCLALTFKKEKVCAAKITRGKTHSPQDRLTSP
ncbi:hypothetical protein BH11CYA1_BH11CYA1_00470 [soil metagenome]